MLSFIICSFMSLSGFFANYKSEFMDAIDFFEAHSEINETLNDYLNIENVIRAKSIVAPEVAMYSKLADIVEYKALSLFYIQNGLTDFSIGYFQMKPQFAEEIENIVKRKFLKKYKLLIIEAPDKKKQRKIRLERLMSLKWQCIYLAAFIDISICKTKSLKIKESDELKYWSTLYNLGIDSSHELVLEAQGMKQFPRGGLKFNYSDITIEFYEYFRICQKN